MMIDTEDTRTAKALAIVVHSGQWLKCRNADGRKAYGIPSRQHAGVYHLANLQSCTCPDFQWRQRPCKHVLAVRLHVECVKVQQGRKGGEARRIAPA